MDGVCFTSCDLGIDLERRGSGYADIFVHRSFAENITTIIDQLLAQHLRQLIGFTTLGGAMIDMMLHEVEKRRI